MIMKSGNVDVNWKHYQRHTAVQRVLCRYVLQLGQVTPIWKASAAQTNSIVRSGRGLVREAIDHVTTHCPITGIPDKLITCKQLSIGLLGDKKFWLPHTRTAKLAYHHAASIRRIQLYV